jgi:hypothetical protein
VYDLSVSRRRLRRIKAAQARAKALPPSRAERDSILRSADSVVRLTYTRSQAAEALGVSRSTFIRRVLPFMETVEMPWGAIMITADELERLVAEQRRPPKRTWAPPGPQGRPVAVPDAVVATIHHFRGDGLSFARIAERLNADGVPTSHGGERWWPSTVRYVLRRAGAADTRDR